MSNQCTHGIWMGACHFCKPIQTSKDQAWTFTYPFKSNDRVQIHSKGQFLKECKRRKLRWTGTDDLLKGGEPYSGAKRPLEWPKYEGVVQQVIQEAKSKDRVEQKWQQLQTKGGH